MAATKRKTTKRKTTKRKSSSMGPVLRRRAGYAGAARRKLKLPACVVDIEDGMLEKLADEKVSIVNGVAYFYRLTPRATKSKTISYLRRVRNNLKKIK